ncbi:MAG: SemiSWEET transporter [Burkholderiales bacterium]|nr:SemiSWEET transporter [Pseudomonadota bacterium]
MLNDSIGIIAGSLTTIAFLPQVIHVLKTKSTEDISLVMYVVFTTGVVFWLIYGILLGAWPVIIANVVTFILALIVLVLKLRYG